ncbi:MAG TPA: hypothetical protein VKB58_16125 [Terriglobales bacterium]|jgi:hypothetical protein|nr:hypothetical protein [Terriglobales bacterium]
MTVRKTVTEKKLAANRQNAKRSTGPRTERGKNRSRYNAVTTGLFADHVVIPFHDADDEDEHNGSDPYERFSKLLEALQQEYQPEGPSETFWVAQMAECMWKQRRLSRSESGMVQARSELQSRALSGNKGAADQIYAGIWSFEEAEKEIEARRPLSPLYYLSGRGVLLPRNKACQRRLESAK